MSSMNRKAPLILIALLGSLLLGSCASQPPTPAAPEPEPPAEPAVDNEAMQRLQTLRESADLEDEVVVSVYPLAEPRVADLVADARRADSEGDFSAAHDLVNEALLLHTDDPELWQLRAELRVALGEWQLAEADARHAWRIGPRTGPLCARHWLTVAMIQRQQQQLEQAQQADTEVEACLQRPAPRW